ncbi:MAG: hypothetical protein WED15_09565 [Akkermansiaceae bacterium]
MDFSLFCGVFLGISENIKVALESVINDKWGQSNPIHMIRAKCLNSTFAAAVDDRSQAQQVAAGGFDFGDLGGVEIA